jgi:hypothetical protein
MFTYKRHLSTISQLHHDGQYNCFSIFENLENCRLALKGKNTLLVHFAKDNL